MNWPFGPTFIYEGEAMDENENRRIVDPAWASSEFELRRLRAWLYNYEGPPSTESASETVDGAIQALHRYRTVVWHAAAAITEHHPNRIPPTSPTSGK